MGRPNGSKNRTKMKSEKDVIDAAKKYAAQKKEASKRTMFKKEFQRKWDACKTTEERTQVKKEFYSYKGKYSETFLDNTWSTITAKFRREKLPGLWEYLEMFAKH